MALRAKNGTTAPRASTQASGIYWAVRLIERKHAEEALRGDCARLSRRLDQQASQLDVLGEALRRERAERSHLGAEARRLQGQLQRADGDRSSAGGADWSARLLERERAEESLLAEFAEMRQLVDQRAAELRSLQDELHREIAGRERSELALQQTHAELERRIGENAARLETMAGAFDCHGDERERLGIALQQVQAECERRSNDTDAALRSANAMLEREISERRNVQTSLDQVHAESERRVGGYIYELRSVSESLAREVNDRKAMEASFRQAQLELDRRVSGQAAELGMIKGAVALEVSERTDLGAALERLGRAQAHLDCRIGDRTGGLGTVEEKAGQEVPQPVRGELVLRHVNEVAEVTARGDGALVAKVRREICVPLNGIICMTDLALDTDLADAQRDYLERVKSLAEAVLAAVSGRQGPRDGDVPRCDPERIAFGLREHLRDTLKPLLLRAHQKGLELTCHIAPRVHNGVFGDPACLRQVLVNLVGNAIKFTDSGEVSVCVDTASHTTTDAVLLVTVADGGDGIPAAQQGLVFGALAGGREGISGADADTGLSLAVCSELVRVMGGRIWFESDVDHGTSFRFTMRLGLQDESESRPAWALRRDASRGVASRGARSRRLGTHEVVLLAEDDPGDRSVLKRLLEDRGYAAITVEDGRGVLAAMQNDSFDLVLMDLRMPGMDAFEAAAAIRSLEGDSGVQTPIVVLARDATEGDRQRCLAVGIDAWVTKPIQGSTLFAALEPLLRNAGRRED